MVVWVFLYFPIKYSFYGARTKNFSSCPAQGSFPTYSIQDPLHFCTSFPFNKTLTSLHIFRLILPHNNLGNEAICSGSMWTHRDQGLFCLRATTKWGEQRTKNTTKTPNHVTSLCWHVHQSLDALRKPEIVTGSRQQQSLVISAIPNQNTPSSPWVQDEEQHYKVNGIHLSALQGLTCRWFITWKS